MPSQANQPGKPGTPLLRVLARLRKQMTGGTGKHDRLSYLLLVLAVVLFAFSTSRWTIPLAAWLYPIFLLRFVRTQPLWRGALLAFLGTTLCWLLRCKGNSSFQGPSTISPSSV